MQAVAACRNLGIAYLCGCSSGVFLGGLLLTSFCISFQGQSLKFWFARLRTPIYRTNLQIVYATNSNSSQRTTTELWEFPLWRPLVTFTNLNLLLKALHPCSFSTIEAGLSEAKPCDAGDHPGTCAICLVEFEIGDRLRQLLSCKHVFHGDCVERWFQRLQGCRNGIFGKRCFVPCRLQEFQGATRSGATGLRGSEREICLWEGLWEDLWEGGFQRFLEVFRGFQRFSEVFRGFSKALSETLSECHFPLRVAGRVAPNRVAP